MKNILLPIALLCLIACTDKPTESKTITDKSFGRDTILVTSSLSQLDQLVYPVKVIGKVRSAQRRKLLFEVSGILQSINATNGDLVKKGQVIATLRNRKEFLQKESAHIALEKAQVDFSNKMLELGDSAYYKEKWSFVRENVLLSTGVSAAEVAFKQADLTYMQTILYAPIDGIVEGVNLEPGDFISLNSPIGSVYNSEKLEVVCNILEYDVPKISKGIEVSIKPLALPATNLTGTVTQINPSINQRGFSRILIQLPKSPNILPGMSVKAEINIVDQPSIVIPMKAVVKRSERHVVFTIDQGLAKWNYVTIGKNNGSHAQVLEGIEENMEVIVSNNLQLAHDSPIKIQ